MGESKMVTERRARQRRTTSGQGQLDTRALEIASETAAALDGHEDLDGERFQNLQNDVAEVKDNLKTLSDRQEVHHRDNTQVLGALKTSLTELTQKVAVDQGERGGWAKAGSAVVKILPIMLSAATFIYLIWAHPK